MTQKLYIARDSWPNGANWPTLYFGEKPDESGCAEFGEFFPAGDGWFLVLDGVEFPDLKPGQCREVELRIKDHAEVQAQDANSKPEHSGLLGAG